MVKLIDTQQCFSYTSEHLKYLQKVYQTRSGFSLKKISLIPLVALVLQFCALIKLRRERPELPRRFRIPGGWAGVILSTGSVAIFAAVCFTFFLLGMGDSWKQVVVASGMLLTWPLVFAIATRVLEQSPENEAWLRELDHSPDTD